MMKKYLTLVASVVIMLCVGGVYAWSIFVPPLRADYDLTTAQTQIVFGFTIAVFAIAMILAGKMEKKHGARLTTFVGVILFVAGYLTASLSHGSFAFILAGIGILSGAGIGFCYLSALVSPVKRFPEKKGIVVGLSVAGFGGGAILLSRIAGILLENNVDVLDIFRRVGLLYGLIILISLCFLPAIVEREGSKEVPGRSVRDLVRDRRLLGLFLGMFAGTFAGLMVVGNLKPIGLSFGVAESRATLGISLLALGNMVGRVLWGYISDRMEGKTSIVLALSFLSAATLALLVVSWHGMLFLIVALAIGIGFGSNFVLYAREVSHIYGVENLGLIYPYVFLAYGLAGLSGPAIGGRLFDMTQAYTLAIIVSVVVCVVGIAAYSFLTHRHKEEGETISPVL